MQSSTAAMEARSPANTRPVSPGKLRLMTLDRLDGRTIASRRAGELARDFAAEIGGTMSVAQRAAVEQAAVLTALAEDAASRRLGGALDVSLEDTVRLARVAQLAVRRLGLRNLGRREPQPSFQAQLEQL